jgi:DNA-binding PadR family transcriptional regulator
MSSRGFAGDWPGGRPNWFFAAAKGRGRHFRPDELKRMAMMGHMPGGPPFGPGPMVARRFGGGPGRRRRGDVRTALLLLLAEEPRNGYQLMQAIEERSGGRWRPSPGSVYPALAQLEDEGLIRAAERDGVRLFELTDDGRARVAERGEEAAPWEMADDPELRSVAELHNLVHQLHLAAMQVGQAGSERQIERATETLTETRRSLYRILAEEEDA